MAMMYQKVEVDRDRLYNSLKVRGLVAQTISLEMGFSKWFIANSASRGHISASAAKLLETMYGIKPDEYMPIKAMVKDNPVDTQLQVKFEIDYDKLSSVIYDAVYTAVKRAWEND